MFKRHKGTVRVVGSKAKGLARAAVLRRSVLNARRCILGGQKGVRGGEKGKEDKDSKGVDARHGEQSEPLVERASALWTGWTVLLVVGTQPCRR